MCMEWGVAPWTYDARPREERLEMFRFYLWHRERQALIRRAKTMEREYESRMRAMTRGR